MADIHIRTIIILYQLDLSFNRSFYFLHSVYIQFLKASHWEHKYARIFRNSNQISRFRRAMQTLSNF